jgi:hypothetical protein
MKIIPNILDMSYEIAELPADEIGNENLDDTFSNSDGT